MSKSLTGPMPEVNTPAAPTPWRVENNVVNDAAGDYLFTVEGDQTSELQDEALAEYIVRLVNKDNNRPVLRDVMTGFGTGFDRPALEFPIKDLATGVVVHDEDAWNAQ